MIFIFFLSCNCTPSSRSYSDLVVF